MMKKKYTVPLMENIAMSCLQMLTASDSVKGPDGTGYGGVDTDGTKDPASRQYNSWGGDEEEF